MKAVIHIGIPKSGTSSIQAFLARNQAALLQQNILYAPFNPAFGSQFEFATTALEICNQGIGPELERRRLGFRCRADQRRYVAQYRDWLDSCLRTAQQAKFVASSEHIHAWLTTPALITALDQFLTERFCDVRYLVYLRAQDDLLLSSYSEAIRRGATHGLATHIRQHCDWNHWAVLKHWHRTIGPKRLIVRLVEGDLLTDFCAATGIDATGLIRPPRANIGLSQGELALRRVLNHLLPVLGQDGALHPVYRRALRLLQPLAQARPMRPQLPDADRAYILACNAASNEHIRRRYFKRRAALFAPPQDRHA